MTHEDRTDVVLDALFAEAKSDVPDTALMARVLADAEALQATVEAPDVAPVATRGWLAGMVDMFGGWGAVGGVTAAGVMGLAVGLYAPDTVGSWVGAETLGLDTASYEVGPDMSALWLEDEDV